MIYITTTKSLATEQPAISEADRLIIFCKEKETFSYQAAEYFLTVPSGIGELCAVDGRDDMLVCLGAILSETGDEEVTFCDAQIPVPSRYADRIHQAKKTGRKKAAGRAAHKAPRKGDQQPPEKSTAKDVALSDTALPTDGFMPMPESPAEAERHDNTEPNIDKADTSVCEKLSNDETTAGDTEVAANVNEIHESSFDFEGDTEAERLYDMIGLKAEDIGYVWPTPVMYANLASTISDQQDANLEAAVRAAFQNGDKLWRRMRYRIPEIRRIIPEPKN